MNLLLDTHILLRWFAEEAHLSRDQRRALRSAGPDAPLLVAGISLWEIAMLVDLGRIRLSRPLREWLEHATAPPLVRTLSLNPAIAAEVAALPVSFHRDPADRILIATARVHGATLVTSDRRILEAEIVSTLD